MKADYLEFKDKCIQMLTEIDFLNQVQMTKKFYRFLQAVV